MATSIIGLEVRLIIDCVHVPKKVVNKTSRLTLEVSILVFISYLVIVTSQAVLPNSLKTSGHGVVRVAFFSDRVVVNLLSIIVASKTCVVKLEFMHQSSNNRVVVLVKIVRLSAERQQSHVVKGVKYVVLTEVIPVIRLIKQLSSSVNPAVKAHRSADLTLDRRENLIDVIESIEEAIFLNVGHIGRVDAVKAVSKGVGL